MENTLLAAGIVCVLAAIVGGGLKAFGVEIPALESAYRQTALGIFGIALLAVFAAIQLRTPAVQPARESIAPTASPVPAPAPIPTPVTAPQPTPSPVVQPPVARVNNSASARCDDVSGTWRRVADSVHLALVQKGCTISGNVSSPGFDHDYRGTWDEAAKAFTIVVTRRNQTTDPNKQCSTNLYGTLRKIDGQIETQFTGSDEGCGVPKGWSEPANRYARLF